MTTYYVAIMYLVCAMIIAKYLVLVFIWLSHTHSDWSFEKRISALKQAEIYWDVNDCYFKDGIGSQLDVKFSEIDLNKDGCSELIVQVNDSYYQWGVTGSGCIIFNNCLGILLQVSCSGIEIEDLRFKEYMTLTVHGRKRDTKWMWNGNKYE